MEGVKKTSLRVWRKSARNLSRAHRYRYGSRTRSGWSEEQTHLSLGQKGLTSARQPRSTHPIDPSVRRGMPAKRGAGVALLALHLDEIAAKVPPRRPRHSHLDQGYRQGAKRPARPKQHLAPTVAAASRPELNNQENIGSSCVRGRGHAAPCCRWDSFFPGLPKQRSRGTTLLGAGALHESSIGLSGTRGAHAKQI